MDRRAFIGSVAGSLLAAPLSAEAQELKKPRIGILAITRPMQYPDPSPNWQAFLKGLRERGWVEGQNIVIEWRYTDGRPDRSLEYAAELAKIKVDVIVAVAGGVAAAGSATRTIPIVFVGTTDPVAAGWVASLARPGGNLTGLSNIGFELNPKRLELLRTAVPAATRVAILGHPGHALYARMRSDVEAMGRSLGLTLSFLEASDPIEFEGVFMAMRRERAEALLVLEHAIFFAQRRALADLAMKYQLPAMYELRAYAVAGGLMSYGANLPDLFRRAASYVDRILQGAKPADLPVEQPTEFELVFNLKTAKALGLTIPPSLLQRADQVIE